METKCLLPRVDCKDSVEGMELDLNYVDDLEADDTVVLEGTGLERFEEMEWKSWVERLEGISSFSGKIEAKKKRVKHLQDSSFGQKRMDCWAVVQWSSR